RRRLELPRRIRPAERLEHAQRLRRLAVAEPSGQPPAHATAGALEAVPEQPSRLLESRLAVEVDRAVVSVQHLEADRLGARVPERLERLVQDAATKLSPSEHGGRSLAPDARPVAAERAEAEARRGVVHEGNPAERQVDIRLLEVCAQRG